MKVVIIGARERHEPTDETEVTGLINQLQTTYPKLFIVTTSCDRGIGKIVRNICAPKEKGAKPYIQFTEVSLRIYADDLPKTEYASLFIARNATMHEIGEEFHLYFDSTGRGPVEDMRQRCIASGRPVFVYRPGKDPEVINAYANGEERGK